MDGLFSLLHHGGATSLGEAVSDASVLQDLLGNGRSDETSTTGSRHHADVHRATLAVDLVRHGVGKTDVTTPVATAHRDNLHLGIEDSTTDRVGYLLAHLDAETNVTVCPHMRSNQHSVPRSVSYTFEHKPRTIETA